MKIDVYMFDLVNIKVQFNLVFEIERINLVTNQNCFINVNINEIIILNICILDLKLNDKVLFFVYFFSLGKFLV